MSPIGVSPIGLFLLFLALANGKRSSSPAARTAPSPVANPQGTFAFPATPVATPVIAPAGTGRPAAPVFSPEWQTYAPLNPTIVARAQQILADSGAPSEVIEPDPTRPGRLVRFLKLRGGGKVNVVAQMPRATAAVTT